MPANLEPRGVRPRLEGKPRTPLSSRVATRLSWTQASPAELQLGHASDLLGSPGHRDPDSPMLLLSELLSVCFPKDSGGRQCQLNGASQGQGATSVGKGAAGAAPGLPQHNIYCAVLYLPASAALTGLSRCLLSDFCAEGRHWGMGHSFRDLGPNVWAPNPGFYPCPKHCRPTR